MAFTGNTHPSDPGRGTPDSTLERIRKSLRSVETGDRVADAIGVRIWVTDLEGYLVRVNQPWLDHYGFESSDQVLGKTAHELLGPVQAAQSIAQGLEVLDTGEASKTIAADENGRQFQTVRMPLTESGDMVGVMGVTTSTAAMASTRLKRTTTMPNTAPFQPISNDFGESEGLS